MSFRQDKLVLLIETGTSQQVRRTAAKQLADLTVKTFHASAPRAKPEVDVPEVKTEDESVRLDAVFNEDDAWSEALETIAKVIPHLRSKSSETRHAAAHALGLLAAALPPYAGAVTPAHAETTPKDRMDLPATIKAGPMLLASAGREYVARGGGGDKAKRRKAMMGSLGLGDGLGWGDDVEKVIGDDDEDDPTERSSSKAAGPSATAPSSPAPSGTPKDVFEGLSARQVMMLKRKKGNIVEEANKMRRLNEGLAPSSDASSGPATPSDTTDVKPQIDDGKLVIDPGAKARATAATSGGVFEPALDVDGNPIAGPSRETLTLISGQVPWRTVLDKLTPDLSDPMWQIRHGASLGMMEILRSSGQALSQDVLLDLARDLLVLMALDRFGDFLGDTVMAPVRETAAQAIGILLKYLDDSGVQDVHRVLGEMVRQPWTFRGKIAEGKEKWERFSWELRHAGLLGIKYEVAVRPDLLTGPVKTEIELGDPDLKNEGMTVDSVASGLLDDVVDIAILALEDNDDDVRAVAATALAPVTDALSDQLASHQLQRLLITLWNCLSIGPDGDELGSSTGAIMDLIGLLINRPRVVSASMPESSQTYIERTFAYVRHPISSVRLSVAQILYTFTTIPDFPRTEWMSAKFFALLFQILVLEEKRDIRELAFAAFKAGLKEVGNVAHAIRFKAWYSLVMTPIGQPLEPRLFTWPPRMATGGHNVDKAMMAGDLGLIGRELMLEARIAGAKALAFLRQFAVVNEDDDGIELLSVDSQNADAADEDIAPNNPDVKLLAKYLRSGSAHQITFSSIIIAEWANDPTFRLSVSSHAVTDTDRAQVSDALSRILISYMEGGLPPTYPEMTTALDSIRLECTALLSAFSVEGKLAKDKIPSLPKKIDPTSSSSSVFSLLSAQQAAGPTFDSLAGLLSKHAQKNVLPSLRERQRKVIASLGYYAILKERYDIQVSASIASALIALRKMPAKLGPVIKAVMDSVRREKNQILQSRSARSVAAFVQFCASPDFPGKVNPCDKVVRNLFTFLCQDTSITPVFSQLQAAEGILTLKEEQHRQKKEDAGRKGKIEAVADESEADIAMRVTRRGAQMTFDSLCEIFGEQVLDDVPRLWEGISGALMRFFPDSDSLENQDKLLAEGTNGQDVVDCLSSMRLILPKLDVSLYSRVMGLFTPLVRALQSSFAVVRQSAATCLAVICDVMTESAMKGVVDDIVPLIRDARRISARQGAVEAVHHIIRLLEIKALPYILFLIVPILGRMSDPDESVRLLSTSTFASLVKMVPLEAGLPDPPGFSPELLAKRDDERKFLMQLLDGSKAEMYEIPVDIKADLRTYQKEGVSWLAFLAKYQLHGILCDDMGLGKSLQSICIVASKIHERKIKHAASASPDSAHLPSLIVCPPTLTGHWYYEILKFTDSLRPMQYVGTAGQRAALQRELTSHDVVIASYESVRADIDQLGKIDWLYVVLDEGHIIKNAKTKLSAAVKQLKAQHRLLLSGTPIQNNVLELWSLFDFLMPGFLGTERAFNDRFSKPILADREGKATPKEREMAATALEALHKQVLPFLLRRLKEDVLSDLPPKIIQDYHVDLSAVQKALYDEFSHSRAAEEAGEAVQSTNSAPGQGHVFQSLQYLRKLCNHPGLVLSQPEQWKDIQAKTGPLPPPDELSHAPKLEALRQLLLDCGIGLPRETKLGAEVNDYSQHRVLIFCQLRPMLDLIANQLFAKHMPTVTYMRLDGSTDPKKRHAIVQTFNADPRIDVLLLTTSVGGLGLNLTGADTVIFVDHDWNPMKDLQAMDRAHRLGQRKVVNVYRLITRGTLEEKIMGLQRFKLNIASSVVTQQNAGLGSMNTGEVLDLFQLSTDDPAKPRAAKSSGPVSASKVLEGLEDLPPDDEYAELSLSNFMSKV